MVRSGLAAGFGCTLLYVLLALGIIYKWSGVVSNLYQHHSGSYGIIFASLLVGVMFTGSVCRYSGTGFTLVHLSTNFTRPTYMVTVSALLLISSQSSGSAHQHSTLNLFLTSMYFRFSGSKPGDLSLESRMVSRFAEYMMYMSICHFQLWNPQRLVAFLILVGAGRSHEVLRLSCEGSAGPGDDVSQATARFNKLDEIIIQKFFPREKFPQRYPNWVQEHLKTRGVFKHVSNSGEQFSFLWVDGTGFIYLAALTILGLSSVEIALSKDAHMDVHSLLVATLGGLGFIYIAIQCFPALLSRLAEANDWLKANSTEAGPNTLEVLQIQWFRRVGSFLCDLACKGIPEQFETKLSIEDFQKDIPWIRRLEGYELMPYVIIFSLVRATGRLLLFCFLYVLRATRVDSLLASRVLDPLIPKLTTLALAPVGDIWKITLAAAAAEAALSPNKFSCNGRGCWSTVELSDILQQAADGATVELSDRLQQAADEARAQALVSQLYECARDAIEGASQMVELKTLLLLVHKFYIVPYQAKRTAQQQAMTVDVKAMLQEFCEARYDAYRTRRCDCVNNKDWELLKAQLPLELLLHLLFDPSEEAPQVTTLQAQAFYAWVKARQSSNPVITFLADVNSSV